MTDYDIDRRAREVAARHYCRHRTEAVSDWVEHGHRDEVDGALADLARCIADEFVTLLEDEGLRPVGRDGDDSDEDDRVDDEDWDDPPLAGCAALDDNDEPEQDFAVHWSEADQQWVGTCSSFPSLSHLADSRDEALDGIEDLVESVENADSAGMTEEQAAAVTASERCDDADCGVCDQPEPETEPVSVAFVASKVQGEWLRGWGLSGHG